MRAFVATLVLVLAVSAPPRRAQACQYVRASMFELAARAEFVVVAKAGKLADDSTQELVPTKVIKRSDTEGTSFVVKTFSICDVSFEEGKSYLVVLKNKQEVLGYGNGIAIAPSAALIAAMERWVRATKHDHQMALLREFVKSSDPKVAQEAKVLLEQWSPK
jgi:hypothetical protein